MHVSERGIFVWNIKNKKTFQNKSKLLHKFSYQYNFNIISMSLQIKYRKKTHTLKDY